MNEERKQEIMEFACEIIGIFEHLLDEKGISIPCADASDQEERQENKEAGRIYGAEYYSLEDSIKATIEKHLENKECSEDRIVVLDRRTSENPGKERGGLAFCCNCGRTMFVDTWNMSLKECPECGERELAWEDESHKIVSEDFFRNNKKYVLSNTICRTMVIWSNGICIKTQTFDGKTEEEAVDAARTFMHNAYDEKNSILEAEEKLGAYRGNNECLYIADGADSCIWSLIRMQ